MVNRGVVINLLLQDGKDSDGCPMTDTASTNRGTANANAIAIDVEYLVGGTDDNHDWPDGGNLRLPNIVAILESGKRRDVAPLGDRFRNAPSTGADRGQEPQSHCQDSRLTSRKFTSHVGIGVPFEEFQCLETD